MRRIISVMRNRQSLVAHNRELRIRARICNWGYARDYVRAQWLMLQQAVADDFVIATGAQHSGRDFVVAAAKLLDMGIKWRGHGVDEVGVDVSTGRTLVRVDPRYFRPTEVETLLGDATMARDKLGWT